MADVGIEQLKEDIQSNINTNNNQEITGAVLQGQLIDTVDTLKGYTDDHVSVSQNTSTKNIDIEVGTDITSVPSVDDYLNLMDAKAEITLPNSFFDYSSENIKADGTIIATGRRTTDYIKVSKGVVVVYSGLQNNPDYCSIACYDSSKNFVSAGSKVLSGTYTIPDGIGYIRICSDSVNTPIAKFSNTLVSKEEFTEVAKKADQAIEKVGTEDVAIGTTAGLITTGSYPSVVTSDYRITNYIAVSEGDIIQTRLKVGTSGYVMTGYSAQSQESAVSTFRVAGTGSLQNYSFVIPNGVSYIRLSCDYPELTNNIINYTHTTSDGLVKKVDAITAKLNPLDVDYKRYTRFPQTTPRKACVVFQMDGAPNLYNRVFDYEALLKQYNVPTSTFVVVPNTFETYGNDIKRLYATGNEMAVHGESGKRATDAILQDYLQSFSDLGLIPYGFTAHGTEIEAQDVPTARKYFSWVVKNGGDVMPYNTQNPSDTGYDDYLDYIMALTDNPYELKRIALEVMAVDHTTVKDIVIANAKAAIDDAIQNCGLIVFYGHSFEQTSYSYTVYQDILEPVLEYLKTKLDKGLCVTGNTADIIEYYYSKRYNE